MIAETMQGSGLVIYALLGLVSFVSVFLGVLAVTLRLNPEQVAVRAELPFDDGAKR